MNKGKKRKISWGLIAILFLNIMASQSLWNQSVEVQASEGTETKSKTVSGSAVSEPEEEKDYYVESLDSDNKDSQGIVYTLDEDTRTASVSNGRGFNTPNIIIPDQVEKDNTKYYVRKIGGTVFGGLSKLKSLVVSDEVWTVDNAAFYNTYLDKLVLGKHVSNFTSNCISASYCKYYEVSTDNPYFTSYDGVLFNKDMTKLIAFPTQKMSDQTSPRIYQVPQGVTTVGESAMDDAVVDYVVLPDSVNTIETKAFNNAKIKGINLSNVKIVKEDAFVNSYLSWVVMNDELSQTSSFRSNSFLETIYIQGSTHTSQNNCFGKMKTLKNVVMAEGTNLTSYEFSKCEALTTVILPETLTDIPEYAFTECTMLDKIYIPESVTNIAETAFYNCGTKTTAGDIVICGVEGSKAQQFADEMGYSFVGETGEEDYESDYIFLDNDFVKIEGKYCGAIGKGTDCTQTVLKTERDLVDRDNPVVVPDAAEKIAKPTAEEANVTYELGDDNRDCQGVAYVLDDENQTAKVDSSLKYSGYNGYHDGRLVIPSYVVKDDVEYLVTTIPACAFQNCPWISTVAISDSVESMGNYAISGCCYFKYLYLGKGICQIGVINSMYTMEFSYIEASEENPYYCSIEGVLYNKRMTELVQYPFALKNDVYMVPASVGTIGPAAFQYVRDVRYVHLPKTTTVIRPYAFDNSKIEYVNLDNVKKIEVQGLTSMSHLSSVCLNNVDCFLNSIFISSSPKCVYISGTPTISGFCQVNKNLEWAYIGKNVKSQSCFFSDCTNLKHLIIEEGTSILDDSIGDNASLLEKVYIPTSVKMISECFRGCDATIYGETGSTADTYAAANSKKFVDTTEHVHTGELETLYEDEYMIMTGRYCEECGYVSDCEAHSKPVSDSGELIECDETLDVNNLDSQGIYYTLDTETHTATVGKLNVGTDNTSCYSGAKEGNVALPSLIEKDGDIFLVKAVANAAFKNCNELKTIYIPSTIETIGTDALYSPQISDIRVELGNGYFVSEEGVLINKDRTVLLKYPPMKETENDIYTIPSSVKSIQAGAFYKANVKEVVLPEGLTILAGGTFKDSKITKMDLKNISHINYGTFAGCSDLQYVIMRQQGEGYHYFFDCGLRGIFVPENIAMNYWFQYGTSIETVIMSSGDTIATNEFSGCTNLSTVILPDDLTTIPANAFSGCKKLTKLYVPSSVTTVDATAFTNCDITIYGESGSKIERACKINGWTFVTVSEHELIAKTFYEYGGYKITGSYCEECGYGANCVQSENGVVPPTPTPTTKPTPSLSPSPSASASASPTPTTSPTATPTTSPTATPTTKPTTSPTTKPTPTVSASTAPTTAPTPPADQSSTPTPTYHVIHLDDVVKPATPSQTPMATMEPVATDDIPQVEAQEVVAKKVTVSWEKVSTTKGYEIYRSTTKNGTYKLVKKVGTNTTQYVDTKTKVGRRYYYKIRPVGGNYSEPVSLYVSGLGIPKFTVKKGKTSNVKFLALMLKSYVGKYVQIQMKSGSSGFKNLKLKSNKIKKYKGNIKIQYLMGGKQLAFRLRTYNIKNKKKEYSSFSDIMTIKI